MSGYAQRLTTIIAHIIGRCLPDEVVHRIRLCIDAGEEVAAIAKAVKVSKKTIYKLRLNLDFWGESYAPPTVVLVGITSSWHYRCRRQPAKFLRLTAGTTSFVTYCNIVRLKRF